MLARVTLMVSNMSSPAPVQAGVEPRLSEDCHMLAVRKGQKGGRFLMSVVVFLTTNLCNELEGKESEVDSTVRGLEIITSFQTQISMQIVSRFPTGHPLVEVGG